MIIDPVPQFLYKFQSFTVRTLRALVDERIGYSDFTTFNDPFDCDAIVRNSGMKLKELEELIENMRSKIEPLNDTGFNMHKILLDRLRVDEPGDYEEGLVWEAHRLLSLDMRKVGVLCLSEHVSDPLMWAHYAESHQGICFEYSTGLQDHMRRRMIFEKVDYKGSKTIPTHLLAERYIRDGAEAKSAIRKAFFLTKSKEWEYEHEWRALSMSSGFFPPPSHLTGIYFGYRCPAHVRTAIQCLFNDPVHAPQFYAMRTRNEYQLEAVRQTWPLVSASRVRRCTYYPRTGDDLEKFQSISG